MDGDREANYIHYAIHELHWTPSDVLDYVQLPRKTKAFFDASITKKLEDLAKSTKKNNK